YHSRVALLLALPLGISGSYGVELLNGFLTSSEATVAKFFSIQNPITVSAAQTTPTVWDSLSNPMLWIGLCSTLLVIGALYCLFKLGISALQLKSIGQALSFKSLSSMDGPHIP